MEKVVIGNAELWQGDCLDVLRSLPAGSAQCCVTSPPYFGLRDYGTDGQIGLEATPEQYTQKLVEVFREVRRVLREDGTLWLNLGDSYASNRGSGSSGIGAKQATNVGANLGKLTVPLGLKPKDLIGIPWRVAFALQSDGWYLRSDIIWSKPNPMPESVADRPTKAHEYLFLLSKSERYYYDAEAIKERATSETPAGNKTHKYVDAYNQESSEQHRTKAGLLALTGVKWETRNKRTVWEVATAPFTGAHFATFPPKLIEPCIFAGAREGDTVLDPFNGSGTTGIVALKHGRKYLGVEINPEYVALSLPRLDAEQQQYKLF